MKTTHPRFLPLLLMSLMLFSLSIIWSCKDNSDSYQAVSQLNEKFQHELQLTEAQYEQIKKLNEQYWQGRMALYANKDRPAWHTAVIATWDDWLSSLEPKLDEGQYQNLLAWQSKVDVLSEKPF